MFLVLPREHPLANKRNLRLADLADEAWIGGPQDCECNRLIYGACSAAGYDPRIAFETDDYAAVQGFVAAGVGVSLIAELGLTTIRDDIVVRDLGRETPVRKIYAATSGGYRTPATTAMLDVLQSVTASYEARRRARARGRLGLARLRPRAASRAWRCRLADLPSTASVSSSSAPESRSISVHTSSTWSRSATIPKSRWSR